LRGAVENLDRGSRKNRPAGVEKFDPHISREYIQRRRGARWKVITRPG